MTRALSEHAQPDAYHKTRIHNVYFDTADDAIVEASLAQPDYKYKIRSRTYGDKSSGIVFFEIKAKLDGVVYKRRAQLTAEEYETYLKTGMFPESQVMNEIDYIFVELGLDQSYHAAINRADDPVTTFDMLEREIGHKVGSLIEAWENDRIMPRVSAVNLADKTAAGKSAVQTVAIP